MSYITWGSVDDMTTWTQVNTCPVTGGQIDPYGGLTGYSMADSDVGTVAARYVEYTAALSGWHTLTMCVKPGGASAVSAIEFENITLANSSSADLTFTAYVPTLSANGGNVMQPVAIGNGYYVQRIMQYATAGNTMRITVYPAGQTASDTGGSFFYCRNLTLLDVLDNLVTYTEPREGSAWAQSGSGVEDAWIQGTDYRLDATVQWVPKAERDTPASVSGWGNPLERIGVNCGVQAMLRAGRNKETLTFYYLRTAPSTDYGTNAYLVDPMRGAPTLHPNGDRTFTLSLRSASTPFLAVTDTP